MLHSPGAHPEEGFLSEFTLPSPTLIETPRAVQAGIVAEVVVKTAFVTESAQKRIWGKSVGLGGNENEQFEREGIRSHHCA